jgi:hypothetical protein
MPRRRIRAKYVWIAIVFCFLALALSKLREMRLAESHLEVLLGAGAVVGFADGTYVQIDESRSDFGFSQFGRVLFARQISPATEEGQPDTETYVPKDVPLHRRLLGVTSFSPVTTISLTSMLRGADGCLPLNRAMTQAIAKFRLTETLELHVDLSAASGDEFATRLSSLRRLKSLTLNHYACAEGTIVTIPLEDLREFLELEELRLMKLELDQADVRGITNARRLRSLALADCAIHESDLMLLSKCDSLEHLSLFGVPFRDEVVQSLARLPRLTFLQLAQRNYNVTIRDASVIGEFKHLQWLNVIDVALDDTLGQVLNEMPALQTVELFGTGVSQSVADSFRASRPGREITITD